MECEWNPRNETLVLRRKVFCIVLCWGIGDRLVLAEEAVEASRSTSLVFPGSFTVKTH